MNSLSLMVCPHDTAGDPIKWFQFAQYLTRATGTSTRHHTCFGFDEFHGEMATADIVYANPQDSLVLLDQHGFVPLVHSSNLYDEIVYIANRDAAHQTLFDLGAMDCVSCNSMMVTRVGIKGLLDRGIRPSLIASKDNWMAVFKAVSQGEKPYGMVYKDFFDALNPSSRDLIVKLGETHDRTIFHSILINGRHREAAAAVAEVLTRAHLDEKGAKALKGVQIESFVPVTAAEILGFKSLRALGSELLVR
jgi:hypothetical protein